MNSLKLLILSLLICVGVAACPSLRNGPPPTPEERLVFAPQSQLVETVPPPSAIVVPEEVVPQKVADAFAQETDAVVVLTTAGSLKPEARYIPIEGIDLSQHEDLLSWLSNPALQSTITTFFPQAAALFAGLELLLALIFPRKRQHYASAGKALVGGSPLAAGASVLKALGARHTEEPEQKQAEKVA